MRLCSKIFALLAALVLSSPAFADGDSPARGLPVENLNTDAEYTTLQGAIDDASPGDNIRVYNVTLNEIDVTIDKPLTIIGQGDGGTGTSIIDPGSAGRCMSIVNAAPVRIIGMMFRNGLVTDTDGGGVLIDNSTVNFEGCIFIGCAAQNGLGGALFALGGSQVTIDSSLFLQNFASAHSAIWAPGATSVTLTNCEFSDNSALQDIDGEVILVQNGTALTMANCTLARNGSNTPSLSLIAGGPTEPIEVANSIIWDNLTGTPFAAGNLFTFASIYPGAVGPDNLDTDPMFRDSAGYDFRLAPGSPAIDAAAAQVLFEFDPVTELVSSVRDADVFNENRFVDDPRTPDTGFGYGLGFNPGIRRLGPLDIGAHEFSGGQCAADLALPFGLLDFSDVFQYLIDFGAGCP